MQSTFSAEEDDSSEHLGVPSPTNTAQDKSSNGATKPSSRKKQSRATATRASHDPKI
jgi:hypothetical protein